MRQSKEKIVKVNPENNQSQKNTTFVLYRRINERNKSQNIKKSYHLEFNKSNNSTDLDYSNPFLIPTVIQQDKEKMYFEILTLKSEIHNTNEQNKRLMSKIMLLQKENHKLKAAEDANNFPSSHKDNKQLQRLCNSLKQRIRIRNSQYDYLEIQYKNLKTSLKKTKVSELEAQISNLFQETQRLTKSIIELNNYKESTKQDLSDLIQTKQSLKQRINYIKLVQQQLQKLQKTYKENNLELSDVRKKLENADQKRISETNELKRIIRNLNKEKETNEPKTIPNKSNDKINNNVKIQDQYRRLESKYQNTSRILGNQMKKIENLQKLLELQKKKTQELQQALKNTTINTIKLQSGPKPKEQPKQNTNEQQYQEDQEYDDQEFDEKPKSKQDQQQQALKKPEEDSYTQKFDEENQSNQNKEQQQKENQQQQQQAQEQQQYQPNSIEDIINFIIYKLKALDISHHQLKQIINNSKIAKIEDFIQFLQQQPFDLKNNEDLETLIGSIIKDNNQKETVIKKNFYKLFPKYKLWKPKQSESYEKQIKQIVTDYAKDIDELLSSYKDENNLVDAEIIKQLFSKMELSQAEIDYLLSKISLTSYDIHHMNYKQLFQLFFERQKIKQKKDKPDLEISDDSYQEI